jgi:hypothetical protein
VNVVGPLWVKHLSFFLSHRLHAFANQLRRQRMQLQGHTQSLRGT